MDSIKNDRYYLEKIKAKVSRKLTNQGIQVATTIKARQNNYPKLFYGY